MNCEDFETNVNDLARDQIMQVSLRARALAHRDECEVCSRRLEAESALSFRLRALAADTNAVTIPLPAGELLTALRGRQPTMALPSTGGAWRDRKVFAGAMAVAAVVLVVLTVTIIRSRSATPSVVHQPQGFPAGRNEVAEAPQQITNPLPVLPPKNNPPFAERKNIHSKVNRLAVSSQSIAGIIEKHVTTTESPAGVTADSAPEIASDFIPVGYASASTLQDGGQLVRVELPRSALVAFGLPMNMNRSEEKVKADVFFGTDGTARAIRFVQ